MKKIEWERMNAKERSLVPYVVFEEVERYTKHGMNLVAPPGRRLLVCGSDRLMSRLPEGLLQGFGQMRHFDISGACKWVAQEKFPGYELHLSIPDFVISVEVKNV